MLRSLVCTFLLCSFPIPLGVLTTKSKMAQDLEMMLDDGRSANQAAFVGLSPLLDGRRVSKFVARQSPNKLRKDCDTYKILWQNKAMLQREPGCTKGFFKGSICFFICRKYYTLANQYSNYKFSVCNDIAQWEPQIPKCVPVTACPGPNFPAGLHFVKDCSKSVGSVCRVQCKANLIQYGPKVIICQHTGLWTDIPKCGCSTPDIPAFADFKSDCTPHIGRICSLQCRKNFFMEGPRHIKCEETGDWTKMPKCLRKCAPLQPPKGMKMVKKCSFEEGKICKLTCGKKIMIGRNYVKCQSNGLWSTFPVCQRKNCCNKTSANPAKYIENTESSTLTKLAENKITSKPAKLTKKKPKVSRQRKCSKAGVPKNIVFSPPSCKSSKSFKCKVGCRIRISKPGVKKTKHIITSYRIISCSPKGVWHNFPNCSAAKKEYMSKTIQKSKCPKPVATKNLIIQKKCSRIEGTVCKVSCKKGFVSVGPETIKCSNKKWSKFPICKSSSKMNSRQKKCSQAKLPKHVMFTDRFCKASKKFKCEIACETPLFIPGAKQNKIIGALLRMSECSSEGIWSNLPNCTEAKQIYWYHRIQRSKCPKPVPTENLTIEKNCSRKGGTVCQVSCKEGFDAIGPKTIMCSKKIWSKWSEFPTCKSSLPMSTNLITLKSG